MPSFARRKLLPVRLKMVRQERRMFAVLMRFVCGRSAGHSHLWIVEPQAAVFHASYSFVLRHSVFALFFSLKRAHIRQPFHRT